MGEVAEMMLDGTLCAGCGGYLEGSGEGFPRYCSDCKSERSSGGHMRTKVVAKVKCPTCGKLVKKAGLSDHRRDVHGVAGVFDLVAHLHRQREFSERTFGPGKRVNGVTDHIAKELLEVRESDGDLKEWVDVIILGLDGAWRSGATPEQIVEAIVAKQTKNEGRTRPDWRTVPADTAIEHDRSQEAA